MSQAMERMQCALPLLNKISIETWIDIWCAMFEHVVDDPCNLVSCGRDGNWRTMFGFDATIESTQCILRTMGRLSSEAKGCSGSVGGRAGAATEDLSRRRLIVGSKT